MDGKGNSKERTLERRYEVDRLEEQVWSLAYEQVCPVIRRALARRRSASKEVSQVAAREMAAVARRA